jgi:UDP-glucose 4-epimerase
MKILVTGGCGFIGSNLSQRLVEEGHEVTIIDNMHSGNEANISVFSSKVNLLRFDSGALWRAGEKFGAIFHLGVSSSSPMYKDDPILVSKAVADWTNILEYSRKFGSKIVFAATSSIYNGMTPPHREDMSVPVTDYYIEARYFMERLAKLYSDLYSVKVVGLRYFSIYGPGEKYKGKYANLVTQFLWDIKAGRSPIVFGDGNQRRDFTYVDDVVEANLLALKYPHSDIFNVGTGRSVSINETVELLNKKMGTSIKPTYKANTIKNYVKETLADTSKAKSALGFSAKVNLEEGIDHLLRFY